MIPFLPVLLLNYFSTHRYFDLRASLGYEGLKADVSRYMESGDSKLTALVPPLQGIDPDDAFSSVSAQGTHIRVVEKQRFNVRILRCARRDRSRSCHHFVWSCIFYPILIFFIFSSYFFPPSCISLTLFIGAIRARHELVVSLARVDRKSQHAQVLSHLRGHPRSHYGNTYKLIWTLGFSVDVFSSPYPFFVPVFFAILKPFFFLIAALFDNNKKVNTHGFRVFFEDYCAKNKLSDKVSFGSMKALLFRP